MRAVLELATEYMTRRSLARDVSEDTRSDGTRREFLAATGTSVTALALAGCSGQQEPAQTTQATTTTAATATDQPDRTETTTGSAAMPEGGTFTYGLSSSPTTMNVLQTGSAYAHVVLDLVHETGTTLDPFNYEVRPNVYTDWELDQDEDGEGGDVYFDVREDLTWNDGTDFTTEDVQFTYDYFLEHEPARYADVVAPIESVGPADTDWDFHLRLSTVVSTWDTEQLGVPLLPKHKWEGADPQEYQPTDDDDGPVGLGPGRVTKFNPATAVQVTFRDDYPLSSLDWIEQREGLIPGGPFLDAVNYRIYGSQTALIRAYFEGGVDAVYGSLKTSRIEEAKEQESTQLVDGYSSGFAFVGFNLRRSPLDDVTFRQALSFAFDDQYWVNFLQGGHVYDGDYPHPPGYRAVRPEHVYDGDLLTDPATEAFAFRGADASVDVDGIRSFLSEGRVLDGSSGTWVGEEYPGTLSGIGASQTSPRHAYSFGEIESSVLRNHEGVDRELYVDGTALSEVRDGPLTVLMDPPDKKPNEAEMLGNWQSNLRELGVPVELTPISFDSLTQQVFYEVDFDIFPMAWADTSPYGTHLYQYFHSSMADDHEEGEGTPSYNATGYGLGAEGADDLLETVRNAVDMETQNEAAAKAMERIYLDAPYMTWYYPKTQWAVDANEFEGYVEDVASPYYANWPLAARQIHRRTE